MQKQRSWRQMKSNSWSNSRREAPSGCWPSWGHPVLEMCLGRPEHDSSETYKGHSGGDMKKESQNEGTLTAIPGAARGAAPVCTSALLSLVSHLFQLPALLKHTNPHTHTHTQQTLQLCWHCRNNRREGSGGRGRQTEREGSGRERLTNEPRQVTLTDVKGWRRKRGVGGDG